MALSFRKLYDVRFGNLRGGVVEAVNDGTATAYPSGGFSFSPSVAGLSTVLFAMTTQDGDGRLWVYDYNTGKWRVFHFDYPAAAAGGAVELPTTATIPANSRRRLLVMGW